jgi:uncharacterized protein YdeI (YjbR/CyaY-like superfamily)
MMQTSSIMPPKDDLPIKPFATPSAWESWLEKNHAKAPGVWLLLHKKGSGKKSVTYAETLDEALCHGWIDGQKYCYDEDSWLQRFTPRTAKSGWSKINIGHVARLTKEKRMRAAGIAAVEAAKADGRWAAAYDSQKTATVPEDFLQLLQKNKKAHAFFATLKKASVYAILYRLQAAKKPETRERNMRKFVEMLADAKAPHLL